MGRVHSGRVGSDHFRAVSFYWVFFDTLQSDTTLPPQLERERDPEREREKERFCFVQFTLLSCQGEREGGEGKWVDPNSVGFPDSFLHFSPEFALFSNSHPKISLILDLA